MSNGTLQTASNIRSARTENKVELCKILQQPKTQLNCYNTVAVKFFVKPQNNLKEIVKVSYKQFRFSGFGTSSNKRYEYRETFVTRAGDVTLYRFTSFIQMEK